MSYVRIGFSPTFTSGIHFDTGVVMNTYSVDLQMMTKSSNHVDQNIAMERLKYIIYEQFADAIILGAEHRKLAKKYEDVGFRTIILPDEPADQLTGLALYCKLQAVTEDVALNGPTWKSLDLDWDDGETEETIIEIKLEKKKDKREHSGENVVEFKPNDKK